MAELIHPQATHHLPSFITPPGETDVLMIVTVLILLGAVVGFGVLFLRLHALPEHIAHGTHKVQMELVSVLCLVALFTHMVVNDVQDYIAAGQFRSGEQLIDAQQVTRQGTLLTLLEPLYKGGPDGVTPGSSCIANAYSNNHDTIAAPGTRAQDLMNKQAGTVVARDQAKAADDQANGALMEADASLKTARVNLGYTEIASPIDGQVGKTNVTIGNVVGPQSGVLTVIVSRDPMYVTFPVSDRDFLRVREAGKQIGRDDLADFKVRIRFSDGSAYDQLGTVNFVNVTVDRATDTVLVRASVPNPKDRLIDGQLVTVEVIVGAPQEQVVVPQSALIADQEGVYIFVADGGKAVVKRVKVGAEEGAGVVIEQGLASSSTTCKASGPGSRCARRRSSGRWPAAVDLVVALERHRNADRFDPAARKRSGDLRDTAGCDPLQAGTMGRGIHQHGAAPALCRNRCLIFYDALQRVG
jgi:membrane fusion protein, multidrug efflux system